MQIKTTQNEQEQKETMLENIKSDKGFTLAEMALVLIISGMMTSMLLYTYKYYMTSGLKDDTIEAIESSQSAIFVAQISRGDNTYPCPADPNLGPNDTKYGRADCTNVNIVRRAGRDIDGDSNAEIVLMGAFPFMDIIDPDDNINTNDAIIDNYVAADAFDSWGNKLTYMVTESMTDIDADADGIPDFSFDQNAGAIDIVDENSKLGTASDAEREKETLLHQWGTAHFAIISHGPNGVGAYSRDGVEQEDCLSGSIQPSDPGYDPTLHSTIDETTNCNDIDGSSAKLLSGLYTEDTTNPNDDIVRYMVNKTTNLWQYTGAIHNDNGTPQDPDDDFFTLQITNTNSGNVGIGTDGGATQTLEVSGDIQGYEIHADELCDGTGTNCMLPEAIGGNLADMQCDPGKVITQIAQNSVICSSPFENANMVRTCDPGEYITGFSSITGVICEVP